MSDSAPTPPESVPQQLVDALDGHDVQILRDVARYAEQLAEHQAREQRLQKAEEEDQIEERPEDLPDDVPSKATITIKEINDNRYYYWQWREDDTVTSKYKGPVSPDE